MLLENRVLPLIFLVATSQSLFGQNNRFGFQASVYDYCKRSLSCMEMQTDPKKPDPWRNARVAWHSYRNRLLKPPAVFRKNKKKFSAFAESGTLFFNNLAQENFSPPEVRNSLRAMAWEVASIIDTTSCNSSPDQKEARGCEKYKKTLYENFKFIAPALIAGDTSSMTTSWH